MLENMSKLFHETQYLLTYTQGNNGGHVLEDMFNLTTGGEDVYRLLRNKQAVKRDIYA